MYSKIKQFLDAAPTALKSANEIYNFARNKYKQVMGFFPDGIDDIFLKRGSAEMQDVRNKVVKFPEGGKDKVDPFKPRPGEGGIPTTIEGKTKNMSAEEIMDFLMNKGKGKDTNIGTAPKTTKTKPKVDPELQAMDDQSEMFKDFSTRNLTGIEAMKEASSLIGRKGKYKNISESDAKKLLDELDEKIKGDMGPMQSGDDPDLFADGGRIGFSEGSRREFDPSNFIEKMTQDMIKKSPDGIVMDGKRDTSILDRLRDGGAKTLDPSFPPVEYDDGTVYFPKTDEYYKKDGTQVDGISPGAKPVPKTLEAASGGRIGFSGGGAGFAGDPMEGDQYTMSNIPGSPQVPMGQFGPVNVGIFGGGGYSKNQIVPGVDMATTNQNYGIVGQIPIGNTGFSIGGDYMKSRANERFTGEAIPGQTFKNVPTDSDRFNVGINFRKQFKDGSKPPNPSRRNFMKLMAGLASLPVVGKLFKSAAKVKEAGPVIAEGVKLGFDKFVMLVDKIKRLGRSADNLATQERQKVTRYEGKDGSEYELVEDLSTGDLSITKDKPGVAVYGRGTDDVEGIDVIDDRSTFYLKRGRADETTKGKTPPDEYDEVKLEAADGETFDAVDSVDDRTVKEILEELGETRTKKASGGLAYMLGE